MGLRSDVVDGCRRVSTKQFFPWFLLERGMHVAVDKVLRIIRRGIQS
jgi:hypothetical protein